MISGVKCPKCGSSNVIYDEIHGEHVCGNCGLVIDVSPYDLGPEWRRINLDSRTSRSRMGSPYTNKVNDKGITSHIDVHDIYKFSGRKRMLFKRLRLRQRQARVQASKKLVEILGELNNKAGQLGYPEWIVEDAAYIIRQAYSKKLIRRNNMNAYIAAAFYIAAKRGGIPKSPSGVMKEFSISRREFWDACKRLHMDVITAPIKTAKPTNHIPGIVSKLQLSPAVQTKASEIVAEAERQGLTTGKAPSAVAAASVYIASILLDEKKTQKEVAEKAGTTEVTIRNRYRELVDNLYFEVLL